MCNVVLIGSVTSTEKTLLKLIEHEINILAVFGYEPLSIEKVSGYTNFQDICVTNEIRYISYQDINDSKNIDIINQLQPDIIFAVGFSQILNDEILNKPKKGVVGFHPTVLPIGRGRAPIAWTVLKEKEGAANFFLMGNGVDDGSIFVQERFDVTNFDDATSIENKILCAIDLALDRWLPKIKKGEWKPKEQDEIFATEYARRAPIDGIIDWSDTAFNIDRLIKASSEPHPGAFTFYDDSKLIIWKSKLEREKKIKGVIGRIVKKQDSSLLIQTGEGLLWIDSYEVENNKQPVVGSRFGYYNQYEIYKIKKEITQIKQMLDELTRN